MPEKRRSVFSRFFKSKEKTKPKGKKIEKKTNVKNGNKPVILKQKKRISNTKHRLSFELASEQVRDVSKKDPSHSLPNDPLQGWKILPLERVLVNQEVGAAIQCCICSHALVIAPQVLSCGHSICRNCTIEIARSESETAQCKICEKQVSSSVKNCSLSNVIRKLKCYCDFSDKVRVGIGKKPVITGWPKRSDSEWCSAVITVENREKHLLECPHAYVRCPNKKCKRKLLKLDLQFHLNVCSDIFGKSFPHKLEIRCPNPGCNYVGKNTFKIHQDQCPFFVCQCKARNQGCEEKVPRNQLRLHHQTCPYVKIQHLQQENELLHKQLEFEEEISRHSNGQSYPSQLFSSGQTQPSPHPSHDPSRSHSLSQNYSRSQSLSQNPSNNQQKSAYRPRSQSAPQNKKIPSNILVNANQACDSPPNVPTKFGLGSGVGAFIPDLHKSKSETSSPYQLSLSNMLISTPPNNDPPGEFFTPASQNSLLDQLMIEREASLEAVESPI